MVESGHTRPSGSCCDKVNLTHWCQTVKQVILRIFPSCDELITLSGGSDNGQFIYVSSVTSEIKCADNVTLETGDILLKIQEQKISGFTCSDAVNLLKYCCKNSSLLVIECVPCGRLTLNLAEYLSHRFQKGSVDHELQNTIRDSLYIRTVPVTTRKPRDSEINGIDYVFLSVDEFNKLKLNGALLESGIYEGNYYGTPKPLNNNYLALNNKDVSDEFKSVCLPGLHPSSEGKRKRNRSNVEAMAAKDLNHDSVINNSQDSRKDEYGNEIQKKNPPSYYYDSGLKYADQLEEDELGPLPPKWEKAYTENGEVYFIDHNSSTSHWLDPRLSRIQKKSLEDCTEDELPYGWERIDDPLYGTYYIDHVNRQTQYENPVLLAKYGRGASSSTCNDVNNCSNLSDKNNRGETYNHENSYNCYLSNSSKFNDGMSENTFFTSNPDELVGERIHSTLVKSYKGLGFTIVGGDDSKEEFLQIKSIVNNGAAWYEGKLQTGDVLVYVNNKCVLGYTHHDMVSVFQSIAPGETVELEVCRGYPLPFDPNDPNTEVVTTVAVGNNENAHLNSFVAQDTFLKRHHMMDGDGNDVSNSSVKSMPDLYLPEKMHVPRPNSTDLLMPDLDKPECLTMSIVKGGMGFGFTIADSAYGQKVKKILDKQRCQNLMEGDILVEINNICVRKMCHSDVVQVLKDCASNKAATITVERLNFAKGKSSKKDELKLGLYRAKTPTDTLLMEMQTSSKLSEHSSGSLKRNPDVYGMDGGGGTLQPCYSRSQSPGNELDQNENSWNRKRSPDMYKHNDNNYMAMVRNNNYYGNDYGGRGSDVNDGYFNPLSNGARKESTSFEHEQPSSASNESRAYRRDMSLNSNVYMQDADYFETVVTIERQEAGFGFRIVGGTEEGSQVSIGHIVEGGAAEVDGRLRSGDEIVSVDNQSVLNSSHHHVVQLMGKAAINGKVTLGIRRKLPFKNQNNSLMQPEIRYPYDVTVTRRENEGFGFVIISSLNKAGSAIGRIIEGSPAERCGLLHVGDHILAVNNINIMNLHHGDIVNLIKDSGYAVTLTIGMPLDDTPGSIVSTMASHRDEEMYEGQYHAIEISRGSRGFGFSIRGGREFQNMALFVLQIAENGPAAVDGRLKIGDRLVEINGVNTKNMTHAQAIEIIRNGGPTVRLLVQRGGKVPPLPAEERFANSPTQHHGAMLCSPSDSRSGMLNDRPDSWDTQLSSS